MRGLWSTLFFLFALCAAVSAAEPSPDWRLVARANVIALATLSVPHDAKGLLGGEDNFASIEIHPTRAMKGSLPPGVAIRQYLSDEAYYVKRETLLTLDSKPVIVFLVLATDGADHPALYFANEHGLEAAEGGRVAEINAEIMRQNEVLTHWESDSTLKDFIVVSALINKTTMKNDAAQAYKGLEALGRDGVSAIVAQMNDRRDLGVQWIDLVNPPNFWEGIRHYGPKKVVDALSAILSQITGEDFGDIVNGGSDAERDHDVAGWRIYDDILRNHPDLLKH
jgi:hypothetical protein